MPLRTQQTEPNIWWTDINLSAPLPASGGDSRWARDAAAFQASSFWISWWMLLRNRWYHSSRTETSQPCRRRDDVPHHSPSAAAAAAGGGDGDTADVHVMMKLTVHSSCSSLSLSLSLSFNFYLAMRFWEVGTDPRENLVLMVVIRERESWVYLVHAQINVKKVVGRSSVASGFPWNKCVRSCRH